VSFQDESVLAAGPDHLGVGTTLLTGFIGEPERDFTTFFNSGAIRLPICSWYRRDQMQIVDISHAGKRPPWSSPVGPYESEYDAEYLTQSQHFHDHAFSSLAIEFRIKDALPRS
jgi:hypothetical protein